MTNVSNLSREIAQEIMALTGCQLSVDDYLKIREKAEIEVSQGLFKVDSTPIIMQPVPQMQVQVQPQMPANQVEQIVEPSNATPKTEVRPALVPTEETPKVVRPAATKTKKPVNNAPAKEKEDPFFAMCNKV